MPEIRLKQLSSVFPEYFAPVRVSYPIYHVAKLMSNLPAPEYLSDISHADSWSAESSACSVEPGSAEDVRKIVSRPIRSPSLR